MVSKVSTFEKVMLCCLKVNNCMKERVLYLLCEDLRLSCCNYVESLLILYLVVFFFFFFADTKDVTCLIFLGLIP